MAFNQVVNIGTTLKLESAERQRFVITGRASGSVIEAVVGPGQSFTVTAHSESLRIDVFAAEPEGRADGAIDFRLTNL